MVSQSLCQRGRRLCAAVLSVLVPSFSAHAAILPSEGDTSVRGALTSGVVGSLTLRALLLQSDPASANGTPVFACECLKVKTTVQTASGIRIQMKTYC